MDYNYLSLLQQIKALQNNNHVISSNRSKSTEELSNGSLILLVDTIRQYFTFRCSGIADPIYIDPVNHQLLNVTYINGIDVSKLITGITKGYGINITDKGNGLYEVSVINDLFALKTDLTEIDNKFNDYTTTTDLEKNYATITQVNKINNRFDDYTTTTDLQENYLDKTYIDTFNEKLKDYPSNKYVDDTFATKIELNEVNTRFDDYTTTTDIEKTYAKIEQLNDYTTTTVLEETYMKKTDVIPPTDSQFDLVKGFSYYTVKNKDITNYSPDDIFPLCNIMKIKLPDELKEQLTVSTIDLNIFKITLRKEILLDYDGNILNDFIISYNHTTNKFKSPRITYNETYSCNTLSYLDRDNPEILFDCKLSFIPNTEYLKGELIIEYLLNQDSIVSKQPTIKCDIIDSRNSLILRESDTHYFYKPDIISYNKDVKYINDDGLEWSCECYQMIYKLPIDYNIPDSLEFSFKEYCFNNSWSLKWNNTSNTWIGNNIRGRRSPRVVRKCNMRNNKDAYGATGCYCMVKKDDWNKRHIPDHSDGLAYSLFNTCSTKGKMETKILFNDGRTEQAINYDLSISYSSVLRGAQYNGYDLVSIYCLYRNYSTNTINVNDIEAITVDLTLPNDNTPNTLTFSVSGVHHDDVYNRGHLDIIGANDTIEVVSGVYTQRSLDITNSRDIILYLHKDYVDPREEISWDPSINPFVYIIQQQYYEILPNPNASTTLYTDYNITSSKIITADNITTMRSDLNIVTNTVDVVAYDVSDIKVRVDVLDSDMAETKKVAQHLQEDIDNVRVISNVALAFGVIGTVGSISSIGMQLASSGISFSTNIGTKAIKNVCSEPAEYEMAVEKVTTLFTSIPIQTRSIVTDISPILTWCNEEYKPLSDLTYEEEYDDPKAKVLSLHTGLDLINRFRDSLKPAFKLIANRLNEVTYDIENIDITDQLTNYVAKAELTRQDIIDITYKIDTTNNNLVFEAEDTIHDGLLVFRPFIKLNTAVNETNRRMLVKVINGEIDEYVGIDSETTIIDPVTNEELTYKGILYSQQILDDYMPDITINDNTITIEIQNELKLIGIIIEHNSFNRNMTFNTNDFAYRCDIEALNKKIDNLAENIA